MEEKKREKWRTKKQTSTTINSISTREEVRETERRQRNAINENGVQIKKRNLFTYTIL